MVKLIRKIVGTKGLLSNEELIEYFRGIINTYIKNLISDALVVNKISILDINSTLVTISKTCNEQINKIVDEYGLCIKNLVLEAVHIDENDPSFIKLKQILEKKTEMDILGYSYQEERSFNTMDAVAKNNSSAGLANSLMGVGLGFGIAKPIGNAMGTLAENVNKQMPQVDTKKDIEEEKIKCQNCGEEIPLNSKFCFKCGQKIENVMSFCPNCGTELTSNCKFCPNCGQSLEAAAEFCPNCGTKC